MKPYYADESVTLHHGDCLDVLRDLPDASVDAVVTDPPYGLEFMGKGWDAPWQDKDVNSDAGFNGGGISATANAPSFTGSTNPKCLECKGTRRGRRDGTAKVAVCLCADGGRFPNVRAVEMRAFQQWCEEWAAECLRVLKPGGHLLAFGGTRTWHRLACAVEDAGFEVRDSIAWLYGSGFPKSLDVSKAIDKAAGVEREVVGTASTQKGAFSGPPDSTGSHIWTGRLTSAEPATPDAERWQGWGTALKPAFEPIVVGRKPLSGTVAANVLAHGTGALNVDGCRVGDGDGVVTFERAPRKQDGDTYDLGTVTGVRSSGQGRWPANVVLDETQAAELDRQSGTSESKRSVRVKPGAVIGNGHTHGAFVATEANVGRFEDSGGASRFFPTFRYEAKAPTAERPTYTKDGEAALFAGSIRKRCTICGKQEVNVGTSACTCDEPDFQPDPTMLGKVAHPTVKPLALMRWLVRLVTPPGGVVLEPFAGSGTTAEACVLEGFRCIAIEREADYLPLITQRLSKPLQPGLGIDFGGGAA